MIVSGKTILPVRESQCVEFNATTFVKALLSDLFVNTGNDLRTDVSADFLATIEEFSRKPQFFTIDGQSGFFAHHNPIYLQMAADLRAFFPATG